MNTNPAALPNGLKVRGGAYLVEEVLSQGDNEFSYRAYDIAARCAITLHEFFPTGAQRNDFQVSAPSGWTTRGYDIAKAKWLQRHSAALAVFEANGTTYVVLNADLSQPALQLEIQPEYSAPTIPILISAPAETAAPTTRAAPISTSRPRLSFADLWPDALRGAIQGGLFCGIAGVLLGALAASFGDGNFLFGIMRGIWLFPVGAICGALLGVLRALPSNAPHLASASAVTPQQQLQSTLSGAWKGTGLGLIFGIVAIAATAFSGMETSISAIGRGVLLLALCGALGGAVVGFIRINPRDRSRRS